MELRSDDIEACIKELIHVRELLKLGFLAGNVRLREGEGLTV